MTDSSVATTVSKKSAPARAEREEREPPVAQPPLDPIDLQLEESFPASDPPSWALGVSRSDEC